MKLKDKTIKELNSLNSDEVMIIYDLIRSLKRKNKRNHKEGLRAYFKVRRALKDCKNSISDDILLEREDKI